MATVALVEERDGVESSSLRPPLDVAKPPVVDGVMQFKEGMDGYPVKVRKPYKITKQREKWTEEEHDKFLEAVKLYGRSWRQIQEHIGTKTAVQIRSHAQKFFSKVVREPGAGDMIEIPPPRPKRKPLHPYPRKCANSSTRADPKLGPVSPSSGSYQENGSPVSVLSAVQSDAFGSSVSNPSTGCTSPASSDGGNNGLVMLNGEEILPRNQAEMDLSPKEVKQDNSDGDLSEEDSSRKASLKLFGKTLIIPDPKKLCSLDGGPQSSSKEMFEAAFIGGVATCAAANEWLLQRRSFPFCMGESRDARIPLLHVWWPYYGFPVSHPRELGAVLNGEGAGESDTGKSPSAESSSDSMGGVQTTMLTNCEVAKESLRAMQTPDSSALIFELKPGVNSAFVPVKPSCSGSQSTRGFVPYKRCKVLE